VLRYDDRGFGKSTGKSVNQSTTADLAEDARQAFLFLRSRKDIDIKRIGMLGHSEGGIVVPIVASSEPTVAFIILAAGFGVKGVELSNAQQAAILRSSGMSDDFIKASGDMNREVMRLMSDTTTTDQQLTELVKMETLKLLPFLPENIQAQIPDKEGYASMMAQQVIAQSKSPWIRYYMNYDPLPTLMKVKCPALILFGELDTQVLASQNSDLMKNAMERAGNKNVTAITIKKANHLFQEATTGSPTEYASLKKEFVPEFISVLHDWLKGLK
jgi:pimeloyl-ACP methyl ester carboxylesterase